MNASTTIRTALFSAAACCLSTALIVGTHRASANPWTNAPTAMGVPTERPLPSLTRAIERDPFDAPDIAKTTGTNGPGSFSPQMGVIPMSGPGVPGTSMLVPNPGEPLRPGSPGGAGAVATIQIIGTILGGGKAPAALALIGTQTQILRIGDRVAGHQIVEIVPQGIVFADGGRLAIATAPTAPDTETPPIPAPLPISTTEPPSPSPAPTPVPAIVPMYRPVNIPQPFTPPSSGPPPTMIPILPGSLPGSSGLPGSLPPGTSGLPGSYAPPPT